MNIRFFSPLVLIAAAACAPDTSHIQVDLSVQDASIAVTKAALGTQIAGTFTLTAILGAEGSDPEDVTWQKFSLVRADTQAAVADLFITADSPKTLHVPLGTTQTLGLTIDASQPLLPTSAATDLCSSAGLQIVGTATESSDGATRPVAGKTFFPTGCE